MYIPDKPFNIKVLDVDNYIREHQVGRVTSHAIFEASTSSTIFDSDGLFSEEIFGAVGSPDRLVKFGYIELNTPVLQPVLYSALTRLNATYGEIIEGRTYAIFDEQEKNFVRRPESDEQAQTGFSFFMSRFPEIDFTTSDSSARANRISVLKKYGDIAFIRRMLVLPAGLRDVRTAENRISQDDINRLYQTLLSYASAMPPKATNIIYDAIRVNIQKKAVEIYEYIENIITGKRGYLQGKYGKRRVALGTRNVITSTSYATLTPDDPQAIDQDTTKIGLYQTAKGLQPIMIHFFRTIFLDSIFKTDSNTIALTNPRSYLLEYRDISNKELNRFNTNAALETLLNRFANAEIREQPITVTDVKGDSYYICLVYDTGKEIALFRSIADLRAQMGHEPDRKYIHPLTWVEAFYMATYRAALGRHVFITRYPVIQDDSCYPSKIHTTTTMPARIVHVRDLLTDDIVREYPEYPIFGNSYHDSISPSLGRLRGLSGDFDGDTTSANFIMSEEANREVAEYLNSAQSLINTQKQLLHGGNTQNVQLNLFNLTRTA